MNVPDVLQEYAGIDAEVWGRLVAAADDRAHPLRLMTMATVNAKGRPDARLMMLRGATQGTRSLWFHTDRRSLKVDQLDAQSSAVVVCYDPSDEVQVRLSGHVQLHHGDEIARQHWQQMDIAVRTAFVESPPPGMPVPYPDPRMRLHQSQQAARCTDVGLRNFTVLELKVIEVQWLQVSSHGDRRAVLRQSEDWQTHPIVP